MTNIGIASQDLVHGIVEDIYGTNHSNTTLVSIQELELCLVASLAVFDVPQLNTHIEGCKNVGVLMPQIQELINVSAWIADWADSQKTPRTSLYAKETSTASPVTPTPTTLTT